MFRIRQLCGTAGFVLAALVSAAFAAPAEPVKPDAPWENRYVRDGVVIEFTASPLDAGKIVEGSMVDVRFRISNEATGEPVRGLNPAAWMDIGYVIQGQPGTEQKECKDKIALYLRGIVGIRPMMDLNSYYLMVLNKDPTISVVDPIVTMAGKTSTLGVVVLRRPPMDWAKSSDEKRVFVTMPAADQVAVVDTDQFLVTHYALAGDKPNRIEIQPDGRFVWVGNNSPQEDRSGVTVLDAETYEIKGFVKTGKGHHEIAFSEDSKYAFVTNRDDGTVSVIDVASIEKIKDVKVGGQLLSVGWSSLSKLIYVSTNTSTDTKDGQVREGLIAAIDPEKAEITARMKTKVGVGPLRFSNDGRWGLVANSREDVVHVIDPSINEIVQDVKVGAEPFQVTFSRAFAYVRTLGSERVYMINLTSLGKGKQAIVNSWAAGSVEPKRGGQLVLADSMTPANKDNTAFVVNPADNTTYFYMEGMNAPMSNYKVYGHQARAAMVVDRSLKEIAPGVYSAKMRVPVEGRYDVALSLDTPRLFHCFTMSADENPLLRTGEKKISVEYKVPSQRVAVGEQVPVRVVFKDGKKQLRPGLTDVGVIYYKAPASYRQTAAAKEVEPGVYEAMISVPEPGPYYLFAAAPSLQVKQDEINFLSLMGVDASMAQATEAKPAESGKQ